MTVPLTLIVVGSVVLVVIGVVDVLVVRKLPKSRHEPSWFLFLYLLLTSIVVSAAAELLSRNH